MAQIVNMAATTETEAVNSMLAAIGEAPVDTVADAEQPDVVTALNILRETLREVLAEGWRFNTHFNVALQPTATVAIDGVQMNVFVVPPTLIRFDAASRIAQFPSSTYTVNGAPALVFFDAENQRDGWTATSLVLNRAVYFLDWTWLPESARQFVLKQAVNRFVESAIGSETLARFTERDIMIARRTLTRDQGIKQRYNIFHSADMPDYLGGRY